jgi:hypothetical protein
MATLSAQYGYAAAFFNSDPELASLISQAVQGQWTPDKFRAAFMASNWYRGHSADFREWFELSARDPAEANDRVADQMIKIKALANQSGISIDPTRLRQMATDSLMWKWPDAMLQEMVAAEWTYKPGGTTGGAASLETRVRQLANDYGIDVSNTQMADWVGGSLAGRYTEDHLNDFVRDIARSKYPGLNGYIDAGMTVRQIAAPYIQSYSSILEQSPDVVSLNDPSIQRALQGVPAKDGTPPVKAVSLYDFERDLRRDPRWLKTKNARESVTTSALGILRDWGIYG